MFKHFIPFRKLILSDVRQEAIHETELALHEARLRLEREHATVAMLETSLARMKAEHGN